MPGLPPPPLTSIPLHAHGRGALEAANIELGLALAPDEIDYLDEHFRRLKRDPMRWALPTFRYSIVYLGALFAALLLDHQWLR